MSLGEIRFVSHHCRCTEIRVQRAFRMRASATKPWQPCQVTTASTRSLQIRAPSRAGQRYLERRPSQIDLLMIATRFHVYWKSLQNFRRGSKNTGLDRNRVSATQIHPRATWPYSGGAKYLVGRCQKRAFPETGKARPADHRMACRRHPQAD